MANLVLELENLKKEIDEIKILKVQLTTNAKREEESLKEIVQKMKDMGLNYKTIQDDIVNMEKDIELRISDLKAEVKESKSALEDIGKKVKLV